MVYVYVIIGGIVLGMAAFIWWRYTSVERGARQRDEKLLQLLDPFGEKLARKVLVEPEQIADLAAKPQLRPMLYAMLKHFERLDLFPAQYLDKRSQGEARLAYWMMHPNELQDAPESIELVETVSRPLNPEGETGEFLVFRYKMAAGHWAANNGWLLGLAGPYLPDDVPYSGIAGAFSRCGDKDGEVKPAELVDWYMGVAARKSA